MTNKVQPTSAKPKRRRLQYSLRTLLIVVLLVACVCSWYGNRLHKISRERAFLNGQWRLIHEDGTPVVLPDGSNIVVTLDETSYTIDPFHEPKWIDFHSPTGRVVSRGIYRREGESVRVCQASLGLKRPTAAELDPDVRLGVRAVVGVNMYLIERVPKPELGNESEAGAWEPE